MRLLQKSPISFDRALECKRLREPYFDPNWHFHPEYQLFTVLEGRGTRFVGDHVAPFKAGDLVLTGPDLPHLWQSDPEYFDMGRSLSSEGIVVYFPEGFFNREFLEKVEMIALRQLLTRAARGLAFRGATAVRVSDLLKGLASATAFDAILRFLEIMHVLSLSDEYTLLAAPGYSNTLRDTDTERMNRVHAYVMRHFRGKITLDEVATVANMTPSSFSRYFRKHANKTFGEFLTEIRIGYACRLLVEKNMTASAACYESGFNTLSNFNRQFKAYLELTPMEYRRRVLKC